MNSGLPPYVAISAQIRDLNTNSAHRIQFPVKGRSQFSIKRPQITYLQIYHITIYLFFLRLSQCNLFSFPLWVLFGDCHGSCCSPLDPSRPISILKVGRLVFEFLFQHAKNSGCSYLSVLSQEHWKWPRFCLLFFGKTIKDYFRKFNFMHVYNNLVVSFFSPQGFQRGITGTCVSAGQAMLHQTSWGNSETMRSKMRNTQEHEIICSTVQYFFCQQL